MSKCAALLRACTPASVRLEIVNLTGSTEFRRLAASCRDRVRAGIGTVRCFSPHCPQADHRSNREKTAHLQEVLHPNSAMITPHGRDPTAERYRRELSVASAGQVPPGVSAPKGVSRTPGEPEWRHRR